ncbi:MAG: ABC transporter ATP-binding protein [Candidatus Bathyarchaeota archaeon]
MTPAISMKGITKRFPGVLANDDITFTVEKGEIHGLLGENGAGKSVLMSILYGLYRSDEGIILIDGEAQIVDSPSTAMRLGIGMVHQHFMLIPNLTVVENIILGDEPTKNGIELDYDRMILDVERFRAMYRLEVNLEAKIYELPVGVQQRVEILKALYRGADVLILDEPTAVLTPSESEELFNAVRALKEEGKTVIFISHKLKEVLDICDRITVLKRGQVVDTVDAGESTEESLTDMMVGRKIIYEFDRAPQGDQATVLKVKGLEAISDRGIPALRGLGLEVKGGEILGIAGVEGNGQTELIEVLMGLRGLTSGSITLEGRDITDSSPDERIRLGVGHIPEDRYKRGMIPEFTIQENMILGSHRDRFTGNGVTLDRVKAKRYSKGLIDDYQIQTPGPETLIGTLSGGNQQRVVVAREFSRDPRLIIAAQPTRGLDVGATEYVRSKLIDMREEGRAVLLISADLDEVLDLSDRVAVIYEGEIVTVKNIDDTSEQEIGRFMAGGKNE